MSEAENDKWRREHGFKSESLKVNDAPAAPDTDGLELLTTEEISEAINESIDEFGSYVFVAKAQARKQLAADQVAYEKDCNQICTALAHKKREVAAAVRAERDFACYFLNDWASLPWKEFYKKYNLPTDDRISLLTKYKTALEACLSDTPDGKS